MRLYDYLDSGNGYKVRLLLSQLGISYERTELDIFAGASQTPDFLAKNPNGKIPALELDDGHILCESNAILFYLAEGTSFLPAERLARARALQWMFFEQYSHEPYIAVVRSILRHFPEDSPRRAELPARYEAGHKALAVMEQQLSGNDYFAGGAYSIADIALYAYTQDAGEHGFDMASYPAIRQWLGRVAAQPRHVPMRAG